MRGRLLGNPFRKIDSSASFERHVPFFSYSLGELRHGIRVIELFRIVRFGDILTAARVGASPASQLCDRMKV